MAEIKMKVPVFAANREALQKETSQLQMKLNTDGGPETAKTMEGYLKVIKKLNSQINKLTAELKAVDTDLKKIQENFEHADKNASDAVG